MDNAMNIHAQDGVPAVESDARSWQHMFAAMAEGEDLVAGTADADKPYYKREVDMLSETCFYAKLGAHSPVAPKGARAPVSLSLRPSPPSSSRSCGSRRQRKGQCRPPDRRLGVASIVEASNKEYSRSVNVFNRSVTLV